MPYQYMTCFEKSKEQLQSKEKSYSFLTSKKNSGKECGYVLKVQNKFEMEIMKFYHDLHSKWDMLLLADVF